MTSKMTDDIANIWRKIAEKTSINTNVDERLIEVFPLHSSSINEIVLKNDTIASKNWPVISRNLSIVGHTVFDLCAYEYSFLYVSQVPSVLTEKVKTLKNNAFEMFSTEYDDLISDASQVNKLQPNEIPYDFLLYNLIAIIYLCEGYSKVASFLFPILKHSKYDPKIDYKTKIQEVAQAQKIAYRYIALKEEGPDNDKIFWISLQIGKKEYTASGRSKKEACNNAAELFFKENQKWLPMGKEPVKERFSISKCNRPNTSKCSKLAHSFNASIDLVSECMTSAAYSNQNGLKGNDVKKYVPLGVVAYSLLVLDVAIKNIDYFTSDIPYTGIRNELVKPSILCYFFNEYDLNDSVLCLKAESSKKLSEGLCADFVKGLVSVVFISKCINNGEIKSISSLYPADFVKGINRRLVEQKFSQNQTSNVFDYISFIQELSAAFNWQFEYTFSSKGPDNACVFAAKCKIMNEGGGEIITASREGNSKRDAKQSVSKIIVEKIKCNLQKENAFSKDILHFYDRSCGISVKNKIYNYFLDSKMPNVFINKNFESIMNCLEYMRTAKIDTSEKQISNAIDSIKDAEQFSRFDQYIKECKLELSDDLSEKLFETLERI